MCQPGALPQERERYSTAYSEQVHPYSRHAAPPTYSAKAVKRVDFTSEELPELAKGNYEP